jgi:alpha-amylase/alpha-mannosidase (GH57 family)
MNRYVCIHGHFYQPPRENPWLEAVEVQDSAYPFHDWNERVTAECYAPNAASRILDAEGRIERIVNNYARISYDFGPTLLAWLETERPRAYQAVLASDRLAAERFSGHGSALAQPYNHTILPLSTSRDKRTQILWGLADFERRFGRKAEGVWLPEAAVDLESLDILAAEGVRFTILEPHQAKRIRPLGQKPWQDVANGGIDTTRPYAVLLPSGRRMAIFFYDGATSRAIAFEGLLSSGERFADRLLAGAPLESDRDRLLHVATDGETYGHHHRYGEMALTYALHHIESHGLARLTNYGEYLAAHRPEHEVEILENTSWSCLHGVARWCDDCGCHTGGRPGWNQAWRAPLRKALDWLRDELAPRFEQAAKAWLTDPWAARDDYIAVVLDRSPENIETFLRRHAAGEPPVGADRVQVLRLLEMQRHLMLMYTSCGWFFNDLAGIETIQILLYAARAVQVAEQLFGTSIEAGFLRRLERARSNSPSAGSGRDLYEKHARPAVVGLPKVAAHYAVASLFHEEPSPARVFCYAVERENGRLFRAGRARLVIGKVHVASALTGSEASLSFGVLHFGDHNLNAGVRDFDDPEAYERLIAEAGGAFEHGDLAKVVRLLDRYFGDVPYSLKSLFRDEQRRVLDQILASTLVETESRFRDVYRHQAPLMRFLRSLDNPLPNAFRAAAEHILNADLRRAVAAPQIDIEEVRRLLDDVRNLGVELDTQGLGYALERAFQDLVEHLQQSPDEPGLLERVEAAVGLARSAPLQLDLWQIQNRCYEMLQSVYPERRAAAEGGDAVAEEWVRGFRALGEELRIKVP